MPAALSPGIQNLSVEILWLVHPDNRIDMIFHMNQNPYEAEQNDIVLSNTVFEINVAVLTGVKKFDENKENTVAVSRNNLLGKWYISFNYPFWKIKEYDSSAEADKAVQSGEADCFVVKAGQSLISKTVFDNTISFCSASYGFWFI